MDGNIIEFSHAAIKKKIDAEKFAVEENNMLYLFVRFNTPLNRATVNSQTFTVSDENGNIFKTKTDYNSKTKTIIIKPVKPYSDNMSYYLNMSKGIRSQGGNPLLESVRIKFKVVDNKLAEYLLINGKSVLPAALGGTKSIPPIEESNNEQIAQIAQIEQINKLKYIRLNLEIFFIILSTTIIIYFLIHGILIVLLFGINLFFLSTLEYLIKSLTKTARVRKLYNIGVKYFNSEKFIDSIEYFENALELDPKNSLAQKALDLSYENLLDIYSKS